MAAFFYRRAHPAVIISPLLTCHISASLLFTEQFVTGSQRTAASHLVITDPHYLFFLGVLSFYLFLLVHISLIILQQLAATWGWADLMSVRGTARRQVRDGGCWLESSVITKRWWHVVRRAHLVWKVTAGIRRLSHQSYLRKTSLLNGTGGFKTGRDGGGGSLLWIISCVFLCSTNTPAFI